MSLSETATIAIISGASAGLSALGATWIDRINYKHNRQADLELQEAERQALQEQQEEERRQAREHELKAAFAKAHEAVLKLDLAVRRSLDIRANLLVNPGTGDWAEQLHEIEVKHTQAVITVDWLHSLCPPGAHDAIDELVAALDEAFMHAWSVATSADAATTLQLRLRSGLHQLSAGLFSGKPPASVTGPVDPPLTAGAVEG
jgi:signal transduction histidine kinase